MQSDWKNKLKANLTRFLHELKEVCESSGRKREDVKVVFATKYLDSEQFEIFLHIAEDFDIFPIIIGENRVQEAEEKIEFVRDQSPKLLKDLKLVMIGTLQKNKINKAIKLFNEIHAIDSLELAKALDERLGREGKKTPVFLEVNVSGEESKHGVSIESLEETVKGIKLLKFLKLEGLMTMAPHTDNPEETRPIFRKLRELADRYHFQTSMGMSHDWKVAIEEGADMIRIGGRIFG